MQNQNRRNFLKLGALTGGSFIASSTFSMSSNNRNNKSEAFDVNRQHKVDNSH